MAVLFPDELARAAVAEWSPPPPDPVIEAYKQDVDATLLAENLKLTVEQRIQKLVAVQRFVLELRRAGSSSAAD